MNGTSYKFVILKLYFIQPTTQRKWKINVECDDDDQIGHTQIHTTLNAPINVGGELARIIISVGPPNFLVEVESKWVQDPGLLPSLHEDFRPTH